jgi:flagellar motility protein MotE (MotC chaperone)
VTLDYATLEALRANHPGWRLLTSPHAPLLASFLQRVFIAPNVRTIGAADLAEALEDELYGLREQHGPDAFPGSGLDYLNKWAAPDKGWLRKFYRQDSDEPQFDLTPATEKAIAWLASLAERNFVGTESRLLTLFDLLRQMSQGGDGDPARRLAELEQRRAAIDAEIAQVRAGDIVLLSDTALKDRFQQFQQLARELLADFREVEHNFRQLDRRVRERIALWDGAKGALLAEIMGERDAIGDSDQGRSFRAFWEFLLSSTRQQELSDLLANVLALAPISELQPDARMRRVHYDWLEAGEHTQRTVAQLSQQLRRFLDDQAWLENRRIMDILHGIEAKSLALRAAAPPGTVMWLADSAASIELPMERPLHAPAVKAQLSSQPLDDSPVHIDASALYEQTVIDKTLLSRNVRAALQQQSQVSLAELAARQPLQHGLAELVAYLQLGGATFRTVVDDSATELVAWRSLDPDGTVRSRRARMPRIIFVRANNG